MTEARVPQATVRIERLEEFQTPGEDAIQISFDDDARRMNATIEAASSEDAGLASVTLEIPNMGLDIRRQIDGDGRIEVEAGYVEGAPKLRPQLIFVGTVNRVRVFRRDPDVITRITGTSTPGIIQEASASVSVRREGGLTVGQVLKRMFNRIGGTVFLPRSAEQFKVPQGYTATDNVLTEASRLVRSLHKATGRPHRLVPAVSTSVSGSKGTQAQSGSTAFRLIDDGQRESVERLEVDWSEDTVYEAEAVAVKSEPSNSLPPQATKTGSQQQQASLQKQGNTEEYQVLSPLDPRVRLGLLVDVTDAEAGEFGDFVVSEVTHDLTDLTTEYLGPYRRPNKDG